MKKIIYNIPCTEVITLDPKDHMMQSVAPSAKGENDPMSSPFGAPQRIWRD